MASMIKTLIWQLRQFFVPYPAVDSWAYNFKTWWHYDRHIAPTTDTEPDPVVVKITGLSFPSDLNTIEFPQLKWLHGKANIPENLYEQEVLSSMMEASEKMAETMAKFGLSLEEVNLSIKQQTKETFDDHDASIPKGWEPIYVFPDDDYTLIGLVDPDGRVHDRRDIIPDEPDDPDSV